MAVLTCLLLVATLIFLLTQKGNHAMQGLSVAVTATSLMSLLYGIRYFSISGGIISVLPAAEAVLLLIWRNPSKTT